MSIKKLHTSSNSVEIKSVLMSNCPSDITFFNFKKRCPTSAGTGTLYRQIPMFHPLNPRKTVPSLGHLYLKKDYISPCTNLNVLNFMFRFLLDLSPKSTPKTRPSVLMSNYPSALTFFNFKNGCPTSAGTGTLYRQIPMFHSLNPRKTVPPLGHFLHENTQLFPSTNQNILNFMSQFIINSNLPHSSHSVEINPSVLMSSTPLNIKLSTLNFISALTFVNNKNGWNASKCYSSTLAIKHFISINYPPKKWNTPVTLFPQKSQIFSKTTPIFNILLTNPIQPLMSLCSYVYFTHLRREAVLAVRPPDLLKLRRD